MNLLVDTRFLADDHGAAEPLDGLDGFRMSARLAQRRYAMDGDVPALIKALEIHRLGVDRAARRTLEHLAGRDLGDSPGPWARWWGEHAIPGGGTIPCGDPLCAVGT